MLCQEDDGLFLLHEEEGLEEAVKHVDVNEEDALVVYKLRCGHAEVKVRELRSKGLSFQIWPAAHALCWYLEHTFGHSGMLATPPSHVSTTFEKHVVCRNLRVLELGAGTGMVGILCAALGAHSIITDLPHVIPNLEHNAHLNQNVIRSSGLGGSVDVKMLCWGEKADVDAIGCSFDLIVASDVVYYDHLFEPLLCTLKWLLLPSPCRGRGIEPSHDECDRQQTSNEGCPSRDKMQKGASSYVASTKDMISWPSSPCGSSSAGSSDEIANASAMNAAPCYTTNGTVLGSCVHFSTGIPCATIKDKSSPNALLSTCSDISSSFSCGTNGDEMSPIVLLAHLRRWKKDSHFFKKASKLFQVRVVHKHLEGTNSRTGIIVYSFSRRRN